MTAIERLEGLLNDRDAEIDVLREKLERAKSDQSWTAHEDVAESDLPVPRLHLEWRELGYGEWACVYLMIYRHLLGHLIGVPLGRTIVTTQRANPAENGDGTLYTPVRDGAHVSSDARTFGWPAFVSYGERVEKIDPAPQEDAR